MLDMFLTADAFPPQVVLAALEVPFMVELLIRFLVCPNRNVFWFDVYNVIDLLAILASSVPRLLGSSMLLDPETAYACRVFSPLLFLLRFLRRFEHFQLLTSAFIAAAQVLPVLLFTALLIALFHAGAIFLLEPREIIPTLLDAVWFTVVTMSTVGYGDITPVTAGGRALTVALIVLSSLYTAIPIGIVGNAFSKVWEDRERLLLLQQLRRRIARAGHTPGDLVTMFNKLDKNGDGQLSFDEFKEFLPMLHIKMTEGVAFRVFETFDEDGHGSIDFTEFLHGVFPAQRFYSATVGRSSANLSERWSRT